MLTVARPPPGMKAFTPSLSISSRNDRHLCDRHRAFSNNIYSVEVSDECVTAYTELKMGKGSLKYIVYKITDDSKKIIVEHKSNEQKWDVFREELINSKSKDRRLKEGQGARFAVYDFVHTTSEGIESQKVGFISWIPDDAGVFVSISTGIRGIMSLTKFAVDQDDIRRLN